MIDRSVKPNTNVSKIIITVLALVVLLQGIWIFRLWRPVSESRTEVNRFTSDRLFDPFDRDLARGWMMDPDSWDPHAEMEKLQERMDRFFEESMRRTGQDPRSILRGQERPLNPRVNMEETDVAFEITVEIPGADDANIDTTIEGQQLTITADTTFETEKQPKGGHTVIRERRSGRFQRSLILPTPVNAAKMTTTYENGVLHIHVPKSAEDPSSSTP